MSENFNDVTDAFAGWEQTITGSRRPGNYVNGRWVEGAPSALSFSGVIQNATPDDMIVLEEGLRSKEAIKIHSTFELISLDESNGINGDIINYRSKEWLVHSVAKRYIGGYNKSIAIRQ